MSEQAPRNMIDDPEQGGTWVALPGHEAKPWDIGGRNEDGTYRPGTVFLEDARLLPNGGADRATLDESSQARVDESPDS